MRNSLFSIIVLISLLFISSCKEEEEDTICDPGVIVHKFEDFVSGTYHFDLNTNSYFISYHVPGTIDSVYTGYLCHELITGFNLTDGLPVRFTGIFSELPENFPTTASLGGQEFFHLEVTGIVMDN